MTARRWLNIINALVIGIIIGWFIRAHTTLDHYLEAKALKYETEASYWITKLDNEIQENKGNIEKEKTHAKR